MPLTFTLSERRAEPSRTDATDEDLVDAARSGDEAATTVLLDRYRGFTRARASRYFLIGGDRDDVAQEGMIGLYKAIRDFDPDGGACFRSFAELCITRQILTAVKSATRQKHSPLNSYVPLEMTRADEGVAVAETLTAQGSDDPLGHVVAADAVSRLRRTFATLLSELESEVLGLYVEGRTYEEIADQLGRHVKSVDNALQRVKRKLEPHLAVEFAA